MKNLKNFTKTDFERLSQFSNRWQNPKTKRIRYYLNTIQIIEYFGNIFKFDSQDYDLFLNSEIWIEDKELFTDNENKRILLKISNNIYKILELRF